MDINKMITARNWDNSKTQVKLKDSTEWAKWDVYNRKNHIHPTQKVFTEAEFLPKHLHRSNLTDEQGELFMDSKDKEYLNRVDRLSKDTMLLISQMDTKEKILKTVEIIMTTDSEKEIVDKLNKLNR